MRILASSALLALSFTAAHGEDMRARRCLSVPEIREAVASHKLIEPMAAVRNAVRATHAEPLRSQLCRLKDGALQYELTLLRRDGKVVRVSMNAISGAVFVNRFADRSRNSAERGKPAVADRGKPGERGKTEPGKPGERGKAEPGKLAASNRSRLGGEDAGKPVPGNSVPGKPVSNEPVSEKALAARPPAPPSPDEPQKPMAPEPSPAALRPPAPGAAP